MGLGRFFPQWEQVLREANTNNNWAARNLLQDNHYLIAGLTDLDPFQTNIRRQFSHDYGFPWESSTNPIYRRLVHNTFNPTTLVDLPSKENLSNYDQFRQLPEDLGYLHSMVGRWESPLTVPTKQLVSQIIRGNPLPNDFSEPLFEIANQNGLTDPGYVANLLDSLQANWSNARASSSIQRLDPERQTLLRKIGKIQAGDPSAISLGDPSEISTSSYDISF
jgi:hypothetical protein